MNKRFFPDRTVNSPTIYGYTEPSEEYKGLIKVGYTERDVLTRMKEHYPTSGPDGIKRFKVLFEESSMRDDGTSFKDYEVHKILEKAGIKRSGTNNEWFRCSVDDLKAAVIAAKEKTSIDINRVFNFSLRPEQKNAVERTKQYFESYTSVENKTPHFLWNCKMRFGKTFSAYKLAKEMNWRKVLILTFKPAVENSWAEDLRSHIDFKEWQFISRSTQSIDDINQNNPFVCFASFQDFLGKTKSGGIKLKNKWAHKVEWDCIILDEYHYGSWRDTAKELYEFEDKREQKESVGAGMEDWNEDISPLKTNHYLYLSGTPFRAIESGEFIEEQIFNWTYSDEQEAKENWDGDNNPYESLPRMVMMTYQMPESITQITDTGEFNEFDLNEFFKAEGKEDKAKFKHENYVQQWLDLIRGSGFNNIYTNLKLDKNKPVLPFADSRLINLLNHTFWFLPSVASCYAMNNLMMKRANIFYHDYEIIVCAGTKAGIGVKSLDPVRQKMSEPLKSKTITLSCGKLTTGVTVKPWTGLFMLRNTTSPETYFQTAFRVQSPWTIGVEDEPNKEEVLKKECYLFDFAPNRALRLVTDYSCRLNMGEDNPESKVEDFIKFLPVLCFDGSSMRQINAEEVLDFGMEGTSGSQLAKKFDSARLVHVDDFTLKRLMANQKAMDALMNIEGFRNLNSDLEKIINQSEKINKLKKESSEKDLTPKEKKQLSEEEKEQKGLRKKIQEKLQKFATRIPVFIYLTDYREETLKDVITQLEPSLFKRVTSLSVSDFDLLLSLGLFNSTLMNSAIFSFKRYENASLHYDGFTKHNPKQIGLFDTKVAAEEF
tara:strand:+ start:9407 stop:11887 length:2481 start_codon:yes stop_codon:yes gene_type:complete